MGTVIEKQLASEQRTGFRRDTLQYYDFFLVPQPQPATSLLLISDF
jgi:hypothetical protein